MKLVRMFCSECGAALEVSEGAKQVKCPYCGSVFAVDDEVKHVVQHVQYENSAQSGYEFELGRMQAQSDAEKAAVRAERRKKHRFWWVVGWIFMFPIPATILFARSKMKVIWKTLLIILMWLLYILILAIAA